jgi:hypothetical protein
MRDYLISIWDFFDPIYFRCSRLTFPPAKEGKNIFRVRLTKYKGRRVVLSDGTEIHKNDTLVKVHLHNVRLLKELKNMNSEIKKAKLIYKYVQRSLPGIDSYIKNNKHAEVIKGIVGITSLNKGCERLGFEVFEISHPIYKWFKQFAFLPIEMLSRSKSSAMQTLKRYEPSYIFISAQKLSNLYKR